MYFWEPVAAARLWNNFLFRRKITKQKFKNVQENVFQWIFLGQLGMSAAWAGSRLTLWKINPRSMNVQLETQWRH